ncbi:phosphoribosylanthranilate isomerase [Mucilaginibacter galii]|nr:phosphoribosylanthranilate isomerase [Mucilaginibacter galii]
MRSPENIDALMRLQPDYMGLIFYAKSPRHVGDLQMTDLQNMPDNLIKTGVFVNEDIAVIISLIERFALGAVQLHGNESPALCVQLRSKVTVLKAFGVDENFNFDTLNDYAGSVDYFLFDTKTVTHGGSGQTFNWQVLENYKLNVPFFLSGGLSLENLENIKHIKHPAFYGVDLNSRFEIQPGLKDTDKLSEAFKILRD